MTYTLFPRPICRVCRLQILNYRRHIQTAAQEVTKSILEPPEPSTRSLLFNLPPPTRPITTFRQRRRIAFREEQESDLALRTAQSQQKCDPYYQMANSPIRQCIVTRNHLPHNFLIKFRPTYFPPPISELPDPSLSTINPDLSSSRSSKKGAKRAKKTKPTAKTSGLLLLPDQVHHPEWTVAKLGAGSWVTCRRDFVEALTRPGQHMSVLSRTPGLGLPPGLADLVERQLEERVVQELEVLRDALKSPDGNAATTTDIDEKGVAVPDGEKIRSIIRQISEEHRAEIDQGRYEGDTEGLFAIIDLRTPNDPAQPNPNDEHPSPLPFPLLKIRASPCLDAPSAISPANEIPIYNLPAILPNASIDPIRGYLTDILHAKSHIQAGTTETTHVRESAPASSDESSSLFTLHTYSTEGGASFVPLLVALWRLRLWHGHSWKEIRLNTRGYPARR